MLPSSAALSQLKLIVNHLLLKTVWAEGEQGHSQGLATISDEPRRGGLMCHGTAAALHPLSHKHISAAAKHHLNYLNARLSLPVWMNSALEALNPSHHPHTLFWESNHSIAFLI